MKAVLHVLLLFSLCQANAIASSNACEGNPWPDCFEGDEIGTIERAAERRGANDVSAMSEVSPFSQKRHVLVLGAGMAGLAAVRQLRRDFYVTVVDAKEYFEFTPGILRAYVKPEHWETLVFPYQEVLDRLKVTFKCGEVVALKCQDHCAAVRMIWGEAALEEIDFHFCLIASGCNFNQFSRYGTSPWFPVIHQVARQGSELDERFLESRRRTILREHQQLTDLNLRKASVLVVGAGYQAVQWACELNYFFPSLRVFLADFMPRCLGPLPEDAAAYCEDYMRSHGISTQYNVKYDENSEAFWQRIGLPERADRTYVLSGAKHSNYFVDEAAQSQRGPGGGGWILVNQFLQVVTKTGERWGGGNIFVVGDCVSSSGEASKWDLPQLPKTGFPAEQQAMQAARNIKALDRRWFAKRCLGCVPREGLCSPWHLRPTWFPWAAGIFAISLGLRPCLLPRSPGCGHQGFGGGDEGGKQQTRTLVVLHSVALSSSSAQLNA